MPVNQLFLQLESSFAETCGSASSAIPCSVLLIDLPDFVAMNILISFAVCCVSENKDTYRFGFAKFILVFFISDA